MKILPHQTTFMDTLVDINNLVLSIGNQLNIDTTKLELFGSRAEAIKIARTARDNLVKINKDIRSRTGESCIKLSEGNSSKYKTDPYLSDYKCIKRLIKEWIEHDGIIIAFDFDNTVFDYHRQGYTYSHVINLLKDAKEMGCTLILFTSCAEEKYDKMKDYLKEKEIYPDYINETPDYIPFGHDGSKIYYNLFLDDRAGLGSAVHILEETIKAIKNRPED